MQALTIRAMSRSRALIAVLISICVALGPASASIPAPSTHSVEMSNAEATDTAFPSSAWAGVIVTSKAIAASAKGQQIFRACAADA